MRLFTAIELPENVRSHLANVQQKLSQARGFEQGISWGPAHNLHVTLKFLGEVAEGDLVAITRALQSVEVPGLHLAPEHLVCFPPRGPLRVIAVALKGNVEALRLLFDSIEAALAPCGIVRESRKYQAHVTLGRVRNPNRHLTSSNLLEAAAGLALPAPAFDATNFVLMESQLNPKGAVHIPLAKFG